MKPVVVTFHRWSLRRPAAPSAAHPGMDDRPSVWITSVSFERANAVVGPFEAIRQELLRYAPGMNHVEVIPTGVD